jgi:hypothetical protein
MQDKEWHGMENEGKARHGMEMKSVACHGKARHGLARQGIGLGLGHYFKFFGWLFIECIKLFFYQSGDIACYLILFLN